MNCTYEMYEYLLVLREKWLVCPYRPHKLVSKKCSRLKTASRINGCVLCALLANMRNCVRFFFFFSSVGTIGMS